jgi:hypothetical protein
LWGKEGLNELSSVSSSFSAVGFKMLREQEDSKSDQNLIYSGKKIHCDLNGKMAYHLKLT